MSTRRTHGRFLMAIAGAALVLAAPAIADDPLVYATIQPAQITLGESAKFTITKFRGRHGPITMPVVSGLQFEIVAEPAKSNSSTDNASLLIDRGARNAAKMAGIFTIPGSRRSHSLWCCKSIRARSAERRPVGSPAHRILRPFLRADSIPKGVRLTEDGSAYVKVSVPKREVYVGESIPFEIEVGNALRIRHACQLAEADRR